MILLDADLNTDETPAFQTTHGGTVFVSASSGAGGSTVYDTITMQVSYDNSTFVTYSPGGTAAEITALSIYEYELPAGLWWRLSGGSSTAYARIDVSGNGIVLV